MTVGTRGDGKPDGRHRTCKTRAEVAAKVKGQARALASKHPGEAS